MVIESKFGKYDDALAKYVRPTDMCDFDNSLVKKQANELVRDCKTALQAIKAIHAFIGTFPTGFDQENKPASYIMRKRRAQCNTKTTLFVTFARAVGIPTRVHAWKVYKLVHQTHMPRLIYWFTPATTIFTYPEVFYKDKWQLLSEVLSEKGKKDLKACPFNDAPHRKHPLEKGWIAEDLGDRWHPDLVWKQYGTNAKGWRKLAFPIAQKLLNKN